MSVGLSTALGILFITLKLLGEITWSWVWVLAPFWGVLALSTVFVVLAAIFAAATTRRE